MKRIFTLILLSAMALSLFCGCSSAKDTVMIVGDTEISAAEYNYTYYTQVRDFCSGYADYLSYFELDPEKPLKEQPCTVTETEQTWADYFMDQTEDVLKQVFTFYNAAKAEGMELSENSLVQIDAFVLSATEAAQKESKTLDKYLSENFGEGLTTDLYREFLGHRFLATQYCDEKLGAIVYSDGEFEKYYTENADSIDKVNFRIYTLTKDFLPADATPSTEEETAQAVKGLAESFSKDLKTEEEFKNRAVSFAPESQKASYGADNATLAKNVSASDLANTEMSTWLFDKTRAAGDVAVYQTAAEAYSVCFFLSRQRDEHPLVSMRHLLLAVTEKEDGSSDDEDVKKEIQSLYDQWEDAGFSQETFTELVEKYTEDPGSKETGGLYESFAYGTMVAEINDWLYEAGRTKDDKAIIKTSFGYHIVWFTGHGEIAWKNDCLPGLQNDSYYKLLEELTPTNSVSFRGNHRDDLGND